MPRYVYANPLRTNWPQLIYNINKYKYTGWTDFKTKVPVTETTHRGMLYHGGTIHLLICVRNQLIPIEFF